MRFEAVNGNLGICAHGYEKVERTTETKGVLDLSQDLALEVNFHPKSEFTYVTFHEICRKMETIAFTWN